MKRQLLVPIAVLGAANAGDAGCAGEAAGVVGDGREAPGVAGGDVETCLPNRPRGAGGHTGGVASGATVAESHRRRQLSIQHHQGSVRPPGSVDWMNLEAEGARSAKPRCATESLEGDDSGGCPGNRAGAPGQERERKCRSHPAPDRCLNDGLDDPSRVAVEWIRTSVVALGGRGFEPIEELGPARGDHEGGAGPDQQILEAEAEPQAGPVEFVRSEDQPDVESDVIESLKERRREARREPT